MIYKIYNLYDNLSTIYNLIALKLFLSEDFLVCVYPARLIRPESGSGCSPGPRLGSASGRQPGSGPSAHAPTPAGGQAPVSSSPGLLVSLCPLSPPVSQLRNNTFSTPASGHWARGTLATVLSPAPASVPLTSHQWPAAPGRGPSPWSAPGG